MYRWLVESQGERACFPGSFPELEEITHRHFVSVKLFEQRRIIVENRETRQRTILFFLLFFFPIAFSYFYRKNCVLARIYDFSSVCDVFRECQS